jgi:two-component system nitrate/nitrite response regulator NarL
MNDKIIKVGFLIKNRTYCEALMYAMQARGGFTVKQHNIDSPPSIDSLGQTTDVLICDATLDFLVYALSRLRHLEKYPRFVLVLHSLDDYLVDKFISSGFHGVVTLDEGLDKLEECITEVHAGRLVYPSEITKRLLNALTDKYPYNTHTRNPAKILTPRQNSVIKLMETGCSNKEIARKLGIELATVKNHVHQILDKLDAKSRNEAVAFYRKSDNFQYSSMRI